MLKFGEIELLRFLFALAVLNCHAEVYTGCLLLCPGGHIAVEFFFLLSGYLMAVHIQKMVYLHPSSAELCTETYRYLRQRICAFWPETFIACCIGIFIFSWGHHFAVKQSFKAAFDTMAGDVLLLQMTALVPHGINAPAWYLSSLLLCSAVLYPLIRRYGPSPIWLLLALLMLGYIQMADADAAHHGFSGPRVWLGWIYKGNLRACAELAIGVCLFPITQYLQQSEALQKRQKLLVLIKWGCYGVTFYYCIHPCAPVSPIALVALACALMLSFSRLCADRDWYQYRWVMWLGRFSLPLYLSHVFWAHNLSVIFPCFSTSLQKLLIYGAASFLTALLTMLLAKRMRRWISSRT